MNIKDVSTKAGISVQAVYKRLKANGITLDMIRDKETGQLSTDGEEIVSNIFNLSDNKEAAEVEKLRAQVEMLTAERDRLLEEREKLLVIQLETLRKIPAALPAPEKKKFSWPWRKKE